MKWQSVLVFCISTTTLVASLSHAAIIDPFTIEYVTIEEPQASQYDYRINNDGARIKRSGSGDIFGFIKKGIKSKIAQIAQASAGASGHFSKTSSAGHGDAGGGGYHYVHPHDIPTSYETKSFDFWTLKKSILNTLLQAVKAIKGGAIAIKGQLIKGGGALISAKGRVISMKGEAITNLGRHIISSAKLSPFATTYTTHPVEYSAPSGPSDATGPLIHTGHSYGVPAPPPPEYGPPPSGPSSSGAYAEQAAPTGYGSAHSSSHSYAAPSHQQTYLPQKINVNYEDLQTKLPHDLEAGLLILKKIPGSELTGPSNLDVPHHSDDIASLPLQDERNKVITGHQTHEGSTVTKPLFTPATKPVHETPLEAPNLSSPYLLGKPLSPFEINSYVPNSVNQGAAFDATCCGLPFAAAFDPAYSTDLLGHKEALPILYPYDVLKPLAYEFPAATAAKRH